MSVSELSQVHGYQLIPYASVVDSDIIRLNVLGSNIIILNSAEAVTDLLEKRSLNYSDRCVTLSSFVSGRV